MHLSSALKIPNGNYCTLHQRCLSWARDEPADTQLAPARCMYMPATDTLLSYCISEWKWWDTSEMISVNVNYLKKIFEYWYRNYAFHLGSHIGVRFLISGFNILYGSDQQLIWLHIELKMISYHSLRMTSPSERTCAARYPLTYTDVFSSYYRHGHLLHIEIKS